MNRKGEKLGWTFGWIGSFLWVLCFGFIWLYQGKIVQGFICCLIFILSLFSITKFAPWKKPKMKYWKLMLPNYLLFITAFLYLVNVFITNWKELIYIQYGLGLLPCFLPIIIIGNKTWE